MEFPGTRTERGTNVDILTEMIAVMNASRAYESDASIFDVGKSTGREDDRAGAAVSVEPLVPDAPSAAAVERPAAMRRRSRARSMRSATY